MNSANRANGAKFQRIYRNHGKFDSRRLHKIFRDFIALNVLNAAARKRREATLDVDYRISHIGHMRKTSLANAKTHLSKFVDLAEHRGQRILILRHGKPAAVIAPAEMPTTSAPPLTTREAKDLLDRLARCAPLSESIEEALGRRRHEPTK